MNLFLNSAQAGAKNIRIRAHGTEIVVSDDGPGISLELLPTIFNPRVSTKSIISGLWGSTSCNPSSSKMAAR